MTLPLVPLPTGPHPARGDSGVCMCIHVCLVWSVFPMAFIVPLHLTTTVQVLQLPVKADLKLALRKFVPNRIRTLDPNVGSLKLYQLIYVTLLVLIAMAEVKLKSEKVKVMLRFIYIQGSYPSSQGKG